MIAWQVVMGFCQLIQRPDWHITVQRALSCECDGALPMLVVLLALVVALL